MGLTQQLPFRAREKCPLCDVFQYRVLYHLEDIQIRECGHCAMVWTHPYLTEEGMQKVFSQELLQRFPYLRNYDAIGIGPAAEFGRTSRMFVRALDDLKRQGAFPGPLLDIGCGSGHFLRLAKSRGWTVQGVDFDDRHVKSLAAQHGISVLPGGWKQPSEREGVFSVVSMWDVLEHLESPRAVLQECRRVLRPGGRLLIACPNHSGLLTWVAHFVYRVTFGLVEKPLKYLYVVTHPLYFQPSVIGKLLKEEGFVTRYVELEHTDLDRLIIPPFVRCMARLIFAISALLGMGNRFTVIAEKI